MLSALVGCGDAAPPTEGAPPEVRVSVRTGAITAPDSVGPGWTRLLVEESEENHIVVAFRLPATTTAAEVTAFVAALDSAPATPRPGVAIGGPEVRAQRSVIVHLTPGLYVLACVRRGADGHRHVRTGESTVLHVRPTTPADSVVAIPPRSTHAVRLVDFAYVGPDHWAPGPQLLRIENTGQQDHQLRLARLREGASLQAWMEADDPDTVATTVAGMARIGSGEVAYLPVDLTPGTYIAYCLVADAATRRPHVELGMLRAIQVP
jgi:hypothetical protein